MSDLISRAGAIDTLNKEIIKRRVFGDVNDGMLDEFDTEDILKKLPSAQPEYESVTAEDFAKTMSESTFYSFVAWYGVALGLMEEQGFVICKKTM